MDRAVLLGELDAVLLDNDRVMRLLPGTQDDGAGVMVRRGVLDERLFTSIHETVVEFELCDTGLGSLRMAPDNPFLNPAQKARLDARGLIPEGTVIQAGDLLASLVEVRKSRPGEPRPAPGMQRVCDKSEEAPAGWEGARVTKVVCEGKSKKSPALIQITLRAERELAIGDLLVHEDSPLGIVSAFLDNMPSGADLIVPASVGQRFFLSEGAAQSMTVGKAAERGADVARARSMEHYSLISLRPLGNTPAPGQHVTVNQVRWLRSRGFHAIVGELVSLKSDDLKNRALLQDLMKLKHSDQQAIPHPAAPESLLSLQTWLMALGLQVSLRSHDDHVSLTLRPALAEEVIAASSGPILLPETLNYRSYDDIEGGLFCPKVFGPSNGSRRRRFGHVPMPAPIVSYLWRIGKPSLLERLLNLPGKLIENIVAYKSAVRCRGNEVEVVPIDPEQFRGDGGDNLGSGGFAVQALLRRIPADRLPAALVGRVDALVPSVIPMAPPDLRPLVLLGNGNFATSDLNDLYRRTINRRNRLVKLQELNAPAAIIQSELRQLQESVDTLYANTLLPRSASVMGSSNKRLKDCVSMVTGHIQEESKRVDWSARARAVSGAAVPNDRMFLPRRHFDVLLLRSVSAVLVTGDENPEGTFVALRPEIHDEDVVRVSPGVFVRLGLDQSAVAACIIHRPMTLEAQEETDRLFQKDPGPIVTVPDSWLDVADEKKILVGLADAAVSGESVYLNSARGVLLAGTGPVDAVEDADIPPRWTSEVREIPESKT